MDAVKPNKLSVALTAGWLILPVAAYVVAVALNAVFNIPGVSEYLYAHVVFSQAYNQVTLTFAISSSY